MITTKIRRRPNLRRWWDNQPCDSTRAMSLLLILSVVCFSSLLLTIFLFGRDTMASIVIDGRKVETVFVQPDDHYRIDLMEKYGVPAVLEVKDNAIRFAEVTCTDQRCVNAGMLSTFGDCVTCQSNKVSVAIVRSTVSIYDLQWENGAPVLQRPDDEIKK